MNIKLIFWIMVIIIDIGNRYGYWYLVLLVVVFVDKLVIKL